MEKTEQTARVTAIRDYLAAVGSPVSSVQAYEVLARALGYKNKHVLNATTRSRRVSPDSKGAAIATPATINVDGVDLAVLPLGSKPLSVEQMRELNWSFDLVIPVPLERLENVDVLNDYASELVTGNEVALEDLRFEHIAQVNYGQGYVAYRVTAYISSPADFFGEEQDQQEVEFYQSLQELARKLVTGAAVEVTEAGATKPCKLSYAHDELVCMFHTYATGAGKNNDEMNLHAQDIAVILHPHGEPSWTSQIGIALEALKYANKTGDATWQLSDAKRVFELKFLS